MEMLFVTDPKGDHNVESSFAPVSMSIHDKILFNTLMGCILVFAT